MKRQQDGRGERTAEWRRQEKPQSRLYRHFGRNLARVFKWRGHRFAKRIKFKLSAPWCGSAAPNIVIIGHLFIHAYGAPRSYLSVPNRNIIVQRREPQASWHPAFAKKKSLTPAFQNNAGHRQTSCRQRSVFAAL